MNRISRFYRISAPAPAREMDEAARDKYYRRLRMQAFIAATLGYSLYYVCRTSLNVMKKPILDSGSLDASQLGVIGSALLFAYAIGKFVNGFIADYCNIKRFMATGLIVSAAANMLMGVLGLMHSVIPTAVIFIAFAVMWGLNGWSQSMGAAPAIISLSRWYPLKERGTYYGFFSASHNLGEFFSFLFVGSIVTFAGWQAGFFGSAIAGAIGVVVILLMLHDTPESKGLPPVEALAHEKPAASADKSVKEIQKQVLRTPAVWILAAASAFMYISRYAINGWGVLFLQEAKGFSDVEAISVVSINALLGILKATTQEADEHDAALVFHQALFKLELVALQRLNDLTQLGNSLAEGEVDVLFFTHGCPPTTVVLTIRKLLPFQRGRKARRL